MKVVLGTTFGGGDQWVAELKEAFPKVKFEVALTEDEQKTAIRDAEVFYGWPTRDVFVSAEKLRWIHSLGTGIEKLVAIQELVDSDVILTNARNSHANSMADHALGMILILTHQFRELLQDQQAKRWESRKYSGRMIELAGRTMGIVAFGAIGRAIARRAGAFGMKVYAVDLKPSNKPPEVHDLWGLDRLDDLLKLSDWLVVTAPLTKETRHMIAARELALMRPGSYVVGVSRGGVIDEAALIAALQEGRIAGAGLDVMEGEPLNASQPWAPSPDNPLWEMENVIITPHVSALTPEMYAEHRNEFREYLDLFIKDQAFPYICDKRAGF